MQRLRDQIAQSRVANTYELRAMTDRIRAANVENEREIRPQQEPERGTAILARERRYSGPLILDQQIAQLYLDSQTPGRR